MLAEGTVRNLFRRMVRLSAIEHRLSFPQPFATADGSWQDAEHLYERGNVPATERRMQLFERFAPPLAQRTLDRLALTEKERRSVTHVIVTSCTGLYAPGLDFEVISHLGLNRSVERTMIGFMGCYAAINALKTAHHIVRSESGSMVLILNLELCSLHFQETHDLEQILSFLLFADGSAASLVSARSEGLAVDSFLAITIPNTSHLITWRVGNAGFDMQLSGQVPGAIGRTLRDVGKQILRGKEPLSIDLWAVYPGGRSILDLVKMSLGLHAEALSCSRDILARYGNMSSATVMFVLQQVMARTI